MLIQYYADNQGAICKIEDCESCTRDCREVYVRAVRKYEQGIFPKSPYFPNRKTAENKKVNDLLNGERY